MSSPSYWQRHAHRYDRGVHLLNRRILDVARQVASEVHGRRVLELAAGTGLFTLELARTAAQVVATDRAPAMLAILQGRLATSGLTNVEVRTADATSIDAEPASFDALVAANLLHLLPRPERMLAEARRVLRPGGLLAVPTFAHGHTGLARILSRILGATGFPIVTRLRAGDLARLVTHNGFSVTSSQVFPGLLPVDLVLAVAPDVGDSEASPGV